MPAHPLVVAPPRAVAPPPPTCLPELAPWNWPLGRFDLVWPPLFGAQYTIGPPPWLSVGRWPPGLFGCTRPGPTAWGGGGRPRAPHPRGKRERVPPSSYQPAALCIGAWPLPSPLPSRPPRDARAPLGENDGVQGCGYRLPPLGFVTKTPVSTCRGGGYERQYPPFFTDVPLHFFPGTFSVSITCTCMSSSGGPVR